MKQASQISITQDDGYKTILYYTPSMFTCKASILLLHGMAEHHGRYNSFIEFLSNQGFDVYCYDHRGHGLDKLPEELGFFASHDGHKIVVQDAINISKYIIKNNQSKKLFLLGHSMGSLIARNVINSYAFFDGVIIMGTTNPLKIINRIGLIFSSIITKLKGPNHPSPLLDKVIFGGKMYKDLSKTNQFAWLTADEEIVRKYELDPFCGFTCTTSFYKDLLSLSLNAGKEASIKQIRRDLPLYLMSGDKDPVGSYGKEIKKLFLIFKNNNFTDVSIKLYPDSRHEILNELNFTDVYEDINTWINTKL